MEEKNVRQGTKTTEVLIDGHVYSLMGADSAYLQEVAAFLNGKLTEVKRLPGYRKMEEEYRNLLLNLNIADEYFKAQQEVERYRLEAEEMQKELYGIKHDMVSTKMKLETALKQQEIIEKRSEEWKKKYEDAQKKGEDAQKKSGAAGSASRK